MRTTTIQRTPPGVDHLLGARLRPLRIAAFLQGVSLWAPVEKLFMSQIGFSPTDIGTMAAIDAAIVPIVAFASGILADRWSRRGVLLLSAGALTLGTLIGGMSTGVPSYILSGVVVGIYLAMNSGTTSAVMYDTVLEERGDGTCFERALGRVRMLNSAAWVLSALAGGWVAGLTEPRMTYLITAPFAALSLVALLRFREPSLHNEPGRVRLREHLVALKRTITDRTALMPVLALAVLTSSLLRVILEFGPLWLIELHVPTSLYGPCWASLVAALGLGGLLAGRLALDRPAVVGAVTLLMTTASLALADSRAAIVVSVAQFGLATLTVTASIRASRLLHDAIPSSIRSGISSSLNTISCIAFLPFALVFGLISTDQGVHTAGWTIVGATIGCGLLLAVLCRPRRVAGQRMLGSTVTLG